MSRLTETDMRSLAPIIEHPNGAGFVFDFSDRTFGQFFRDEVGVDIDNPRWEREGGSKGKRLRYFLRTADDAIALRALLALWRYRKTMLTDRDEQEPVHGARDRVVRMAKKLGWKEKARRPSPSTPTSGEPLPLAPEKQRELIDRLLRLSALAPQPRGFQFERFLFDLFKETGLDPRASFRNTGEQIDGSFMLHGEVYLLEAKWTGPPVSIGDLHTFEGKVGSKAEWARGLFLSYSGFSEDAFKPFGSRKRIVCMDGSDLHEALDRNVPLPTVLGLKVRRAAETGRPFVPLRELHAT